MKKILGLDLGTNSIGWAVVDEAESAAEKSSIVKLGVRVNPLTVDEKSNFEKGKSITTNADRTLKRSMRRNLQRYKLRRKNLIEILKDAHFIADESILSENGNRTTFETYRLRARAATEKISLEEFARVLLMINKKRGYKSSRKAKGTEDGTLIDGMDFAKRLYEENLTPGQLCLQLLNDGKKQLPDFYRSDLQNEFDRIWNFQQQFHLELLTNKLKEGLRGKNEKATWAICKKPFGIVGVKRETKGDELKKEEYSWRVKALSEKMDLEQLVVVLQKINGKVSNSSGYLGAISDRSKELYFAKQTVGQYLMAQLNENSNASLTNQVFYRQDYLDEFDALWEKQAEFRRGEANSPFTDELKTEIRNVVIFYQRKLKSQKGLVGFCEFESRQIEVELEGKTKIKTTGSKVIPRSAPLFQEFKIWQILNNIEVLDKTTGEVFKLTIEEKELLFSKLQTVESLTTKEFLEILFDKKARKYEINYKEKIEGNKTRAKIFDILGSVDDENLEKLWHLLYSWEGENAALATKLTENFGYETKIAKRLSNIVLQDDYGSLSAKAIKKILPYLKEGNQYDLSCEYAGYRHSKNSLTKEEIDNKVLKEKLNILPKNSLRNPVVEKILNQMVNVINTIIDTYGKPDEIRVELARELKKNAKEREEMTLAISKTTAEYAEIRKKLMDEFGLSHVSRNDIIRYKLYEELKDNGYKTPYSNTYISQEKLFSKEFDIEHIIPQARLFDDSFSNKTLEARAINIEKGNKTAYDFVKEKYGEQGLCEYLSRIETLFQDKKTKLKKLKMIEKDIPDGFIERDLRNTQYIAKKALSMLSDISRRVVATTGSITDYLREDWGLIDVMKELNWDKYKALGLVEYFKDKDGRQIGRIKDWTKRNDHRHHAMDALTVAFTKDTFIQYFNNKNASFTPNSNEYALKTKYFDNGKAIPPIPINEFRIEAKKHLENTLVSIKAKNKVVTRNINITKKNGGTNKKMQLTPRGQLHNETIYGSYQKPIVKIDKKTGKKVVSFETIYTIRKEIGPDIKIDKVIDLKIQKILTDRLAEFNGDAKKAFVNLEENPIWLNKDKGIAIKRVAISGINNAEKIPTGFVSTSNNHHVAIYKDTTGKFQEVVVSFFEATNRANKGLPIVDKDYKKDEGWQFLFSMKQNEYFIFPNEKTGFNPQEMDLLNPENYAVISPNLFRVQKIATKNYMFRHHLETKVSYETKEMGNNLRGIAWELISTPTKLENIVKVRINHIGQVVSVGEY
ncbi:CRISPR-associated endonuclease Cas9 [Fibrobacterales bacterium]|nr:CRISPR-associated endonuclease Cas9 [Fibrobacterales bacterium]